jgi:uncharacterized membrane protein
MSTTTPSLHDVTRRNVESIAKMESASINDRTVGERWADYVADCVGSWVFLIIQSVLLLAWMALNVTAWWTPWDPYPFVLLNLVLSFQAAFATPIILMSENRQARLSERRNHLDLQINMLAEQENTEQLRLLRLICEKAGIEIPDGDVKILEQPTNPNEITRQIVESVEGVNQTKQ